MQSLINRNVGPWFSPVNRVRLKSQQGTTRVTRLRFRCWTLTWPDSKYNFSQSSQHAVMICNAVYSVRQHFLTDMGNLNIKNWTPGDWKVPSGFGCGVKMSLQRTQALIHHISTIRYDTAISIIRTPLKDISKTSKYVQLIINPH